MDGGELPTRDEWLEEQKSKDGSRKPMSKFDSGKGQNIIQGRK